jgi:hypothetical protein
MTKLQKQQASSQPFGRYARPLPLIDWATASALLENSSSRTVSLPTKMSPLAGPSSRSQRHSSLPLMKGLQSLFSRKRDGGNAANNETPALRGLYSLQPGRRETVAGTPYNQLAMSPVEAQGNVSRWPSQPPPRPPRPAEPLFPLSESSPRASRTSTTRLSYVECESCAGGHAANPVDSQGPSFFGQDAAIRPQTQQGDDLAWWEQSARSTSPREKRRSITADTRTASTAEKALPPLPPGGVPVKLSPRRAQMDDPTMMRDTKLSQIPQSKSARRRPATPPPPASSPEPQEQHTVQRQASMRLGEIRSATPPFPPSQPESSSHEQSTDWSRCEEHKAYTYTYQTSQCSS